MSIEDFIKSNKKTAENIIIQADDGMQFHARMHYSRVDYNSDWAVYGQGFNAIIINPDNNSNVGAVIIHKHQSEYKPEKEESPFSLIKFINKVSFGMVKLPAVQVAKEISENKKEYNITVYLAKKDPVPNIVVKSSNMAGGWTRIFMREVAEYLLPKWKEMGGKKAEFEVKPHISSFDHTDSHQAEYVQKIYDISSLLLEIGIADGLFSTKTIGEAIKGLGDLLQEFKTTDLLSSDKRIANNFSQIISNIIGYKEIAKGMQEGASKFINPDSGKPQTL